MKKKIERLETVVVLCLEKIERLQHLITELKPEEDENTQQD